MDGLTCLVLVALVVLGVFIYNWHTGNWDRPSWYADWFEDWFGGQSKGTCQPTHDSPPVVKVVTVGLRGSGKTVLLANIYERFRTPAYQPYSLTEASPVKAIELANLYDKIQDTKQDWPLSTSASSVRPYSFEVKSPAALSQNLFTLQYIDYAGEMLTEATAPRDIQQELFDDIKSAHGLIGVIDGRLLMTGPLKSLFNGPKLQRNLTVLVDVINRSKCPTTFIITKWDLLSKNGDEEKTLRRVKDLLFKDQHFANMIKQQAAAGRTVRLIPVSAVGSTFAQWNGENVVKLRNGRIRPTNLEIPLSAVLPDLVDQAVAALDQQDRREILQAAGSPSGPNPLIIKRVGVAIMEILGASVGFPALGAVAGLGGDIIVDYLTSFGKPALTPAQRAQTAQLNADYRKARAHVLAVMRSDVISLEKRLPSSVLSRGTINV